jgi:hypothetical protein
MMKSPCDDMQIAVGSGGVDRPGWREWKEAQYYISKVRSNGRREGGHHEVD